MFRIGQFFEAVCAKSVKEAKHWQLLFCEGGESFDEIVDAHQVLSLVLPIPKKYCQLGMPHSLALL